MLRFNSVRCKCNKSSLLVCQTISRLACYNEQTYKSFPLTCEQLICAIALIKQMLINV